MISRSKYVYEQLFDEIVDMINNGNINIGDKLPSERQLANHFSSNYHTVRKAMSMLADSGIIEKQPAIGSFVKRIPRFMPNVDGQYSNGDDRKGLGVIYQRKNSNFNREFLEWLNKKAQQSDCFLNIREVEKLDTGALVISRQMWLQGCFALLVLPDREKATENDVANFVRKSTLPSILLDFYAGSEDACINTGTEVQGFIITSTIVAVDYMHRLGYKNLAFFGPDIFASSSGKLFAFSKYVSSRDIQPLIGLVKDDVEQLESMVKKWAKFAGNIGVICYDDYHAVKLMSTVQKLQLRVPEDFAIIGANDSPVCSFSNPALTTVKFPFESLAAETIKYAYSLKEGNPQKIGSEFMGKLIIRGSCGGIFQGKEKLREIISGLEENNSSFKVTINTNFTKE